MNLKDLEDEDIGLRIEAWRSALKRLERGKISPKSLKQELPYLYELLTSSFEMDRAEAWEIASKLMEKGVGDADELRKRLKYLYLLVRRGENFLLGEGVWSIVVRLMNAGVIEGEVRNRFLLVLESRKLRARLEAWKQLKDFDFRDVLVKRRKYFLELLRAGDPWLRLKAWETALDLLNKGIVSPKSIQRRLRFLYSFFKRGEDFTMSDVVKVILKLKDMGIVGELNDVMLEALSRDEELPSLWKGVIELLDAGLVEQKVVKSRLRFLFLLFYSGDLYVKEGALEVSLSLLDRGIINRKQLRGKVRFLIMGLGSRDMFYRAFCWEVTPRLMRAGLVGEDTVRDKLNYLYELLDHGGCYDNSMSLECPALKGWRVTVELFQLLDLDELRWYLDRYLWLLEKPNLLVTDQDLQVLRTLVERGVMSVDHIVRLMENRYFEVSLYAWSVAVSMAKEGKLEKEKISENLDYLRRLYRRATKEGRRPLEELIERLKELGIRTLVE